MVPEDIGPHLIRLQSTVHCCEDHRFKKLAIYIVLKLLVDVTAFIMALFVATGTELRCPVLLSGNVVAHYHSLIRQGDSSPKIVYLDELW